MASTKISELVELQTASGLEAIPVVFQGHNFRIPVNKLKAGLNLAKTDVGLDKVDNTSDADKPVSALQKQALDTKAELVHSHTLTEVGGLAAALDAKADKSEVATKVDIGNLETEIAGKASTVHTHVISDVEGLTEQFSDVNLRISKVDQKETQLESEMAGKANTVHTHELTNVNGLVDALTARPTAEAVTAALLTKAEVKHKHEVQDIVGLEELQTPTVVFTENNW